MTKRIRGGGEGGEGEGEGGRGYCTRDTLNLIDFNKFILKLTCNFCKLLSHSII